MMESYIQYAGGYSKTAVKSADIIEALEYLQNTDEEHAAFWLVVMSGKEEQVLEVDRDKNLIWVMDGEDWRHKAHDWREVLECMELLLRDAIELLKRKMLR